MSPIRTALSNETIDQHTRIHLAERVPGSSFRETVCVRVFVLLSVGLISRWLRFFTMSRSFVLCERYLLCVTYLRTVGQPTGCTFDAAFCLMGSARPPPDPSVQTQVLFMQMDRRFTSTVPRIFPTTLLKKEVGKTSTLKHPLN